METYSLKYPAEGLEEGEVSDNSDEGYTPLQRPETLPGQCLDATMAGSVSSSKMDDTEDTPDSEHSSETSSESDDGVKRLTLDKSERRLAKKAKKWPLAKRADRQAASKLDPRPKKYNVWSESLQEESLMENMRGFDVTKDKKNDRNVEAYDFSLKYRLNGENRLKRRLDDHSDEEYHQNKKRARHDAKPAKQRLGSRRSSDNTPRHILNIETREEDSAAEVARDIANKLYEEKDDLMLRVVEILGKQMAMELFKETQRVELEGGMMIMNGKRRRTPGGVFLFLLKTEDKIADECKAAIFREDVKKAAIERKTLQALRRDQKVEELKKRLKMKDKETKPLSSRADATHSVPYSNAEENGTLSNPPPSPVANSAHENSPEYISHAINHVNDCSPGKRCVKVSDDPDDDSLTAYDEDFLEMNCDDMDLF